jgi:hypothetical protein
MPNFDSLRKLFCGWAISLAVIFFLLAPTQSWAAEPTTATPTAAATVAPTAAQQDQQTEDQQTEDQQTQAQQHALLLQQVKQAHEQSKQVQLQMQESAKQAQAAAATAGSYVQSDIQAHNMYDQ